MARDIIKLDHTGLDVALKGVGGVNFDLVSKIWGITTNFGI